MLSVGRKTTFLCVHKSNRRFGLFPKRQQDENCQNEAIIVLASDGLRRINPSICEDFSVIRSLKLYAILSPTRPDFSSSVEVRQPSRNTNRKAQRISCQPTASEVRGTCKNLTMIIDLRHVGHVLHFGRNQRCSHGFILETVQESKFLVVL